MSELLIGTGISSSAAPQADPVAEALAAERAGYDFVSASDHPVGDHATYDVLTMLAWVAAGSALSTDGDYHEIVTFADLFTESGAVSAVMPVSTGAHTVDLQAREFGARLPHRRARSVPGVHALGLVRPC